MDERAKAVREVVQAAQKLVANRDGLVGPIAESSGLSRQNVELALAGHLELNPSEAEVASLLASVTETPQIAVVLSANVFVAALRAIALARAAAPKVLVRPSRREPVFAKALVEALNHPDVTLEEELDLSSIETGEIHVYGRDETIAAIRAKSRVPVRGHGAGMGIAVATKVSSAALLADDVIVFDQRGCLSPRLAFVHPSIAQPFAEALHEALSSTSIPRGELTSSERAEAERWIAMMTYVGDVLVGKAHAVGIGPVSIPPAHRMIQVVPCARQRVARLIAPLAKAIVTVGSDRDVRDIAPEHARLSAIGSMQRPPLDGPVDRREELTGNRQQATGNG